VTPVLDVLPSFRYPLPADDVFISLLPKLREPIKNAAASATGISVSDVRLLSPVANPGKIVAATVNYVKHLQEVADNPNLRHQNAAHLRPIQEIGLFLKASSSEKVGEMSVKVSEN
jgi:2,4-diketo-3-deoxy-L-fuconate hydrolase